MRCAHRWQRLTDYSNSEGAKDAPSSKKEKKVLSINTIIAVVLSIFAVDLTAAAIVLGSIVPQIASSSSATTATTAAPNTTSQVTSSPTTAQFRCPTGFTLSADGLGCDDENECRHSNGQCDTYCVNTAGSFACSCETGFQLDDDGFTCKDYNECERSNGGCSHGCVNTLGSYACECPNTHYKEVDNKTCHEIDCPAGFQMSTLENECININECAGDHGCQRNCIDENGSYFCTCDDGEVLHVDGKHCDAKFLCPDGYELAASEDQCEKFQCPDGYEMASSGDQCENIDECALEDHGCEKNCTDTNGSYRCECDFGEFLDDDGKHCDPLIKTNRCEFSWWTAIDKLNSCYTIGYTKNYNQAKSACEAQGMHVLTIDSSEKMEFAVQLIKKTVIYKSFVGATKLSGDWLWEDTGLPVPSSVWEDGYPTSDNNDCAYLGSEKMINTRCNYALEYICEYLFD